MRGPMSAAPVSQTRMVRTGRPSVVTLRNGDCRIVHREYIGEIVAGAGAGTPFNVSSYPLNPGQASVFPWMSKIAANFESYVFNKLHFDYETEAPSSLGGTLVMAVDYDSVDAVPSNKQQALAYRGSVRSAPWNPCSHTSIREDLHKQKTNYVRFGPQPAATDLKTYDIGNLFVITQGVTTASATCGELYVEYDVLLKTPVFEPVVPNGSFTNSSGTLVTTGNFLGAVANLVSSGSILITAPSNNVVQLTGLQVGSEISVNYLLVAAAITGKLVMAATTGLTLKTQVSGTPAADVAYSSTQTFIVSLATATITLSGITVITTPTLAALLVVSYSPVLTGL